MRITVEMNGRLKVYLEENLESNMQDTSLELRGNIFQSLNHYDLEQLSFILQFSFSGATLD